MFANVATSMAVEIAAISVETVSIALFVSNILYFS
jgi:hypothetical protein